MNPFITPSMGDTTPLNTSPRRALALKPSMKFDMPLDKRSKEIKPKKKSNIISQVYFTPWKKSMRNKIKRLHTSTFGHDDFNLQINPVFGEHNKVDCPFAD